MGNDSCANARARDHSIIIQLRGCARARASQINLLASNGISTMVFGRLHGDNPIRVNVRMSLSIYTIYETQINIHTRPHSIDLMWSLAQHYLGARSTYIWLFRDHRTKWVFPARRASNRRIYIWYYVRATLWPLRRNNCQLHSGVFALAHI